MGYLGPSLALLGGPGGHLEATLGLGRLASGVQGGQKLRFQKHQDSEGKSMLLADFWRQQAFTKLAKWLLGGLVVGLKLWREQLACHVGSKLGSTRQARASDQPNMFQGACMLGAT